METSTRNGLAVIKEYEGCRLKAYPDPATHAEPWTIGWGHTKGVQAGDICSQAQADAWLVAEYDAVEARVRSLLTIAVTANQLGALVSFAYNLGIGNLKASTLLKRVNAGRFDEAAQQFAVWNKAAGKVMSGLTKRRAAEAGLFARPVNNG